MVTPCLHFLTWYNFSFGGTTVQCGPSVALQSNADLRLLNGPSQSALFFFYLSFQLLILHFLTYVCTQFHHLFLGRPLGRLPWELLLNTWLTVLLLSISTRISLLILSTKRLNIFLQLESRQLTVRQTSLSSRMTGTLLPSRLNKKYLHKTSYLTAVKTKEIENRMSVVCHYSFNMQKKKFILPLQHHRSVT
jgi:hypothetical protein